MKPTIDSGAQAWVNYCQIQNRQINQLEKENARLESMLWRCLQVFENVLGEVDINLFPDKKILKWYEERKKK